MEEILGEPASSFSNRKKKTYSAVKSGPDASTVDWEKHQYPGIMRQVCHGGKFTHLKSDGARGFDNVVEVNL
jgi:hypothetical protein